MSDVTTRKTRLFLSYSRKDLVFAEGLHQALEDVGYDVLLDRTDIAAGEDWQARLGRLIIEADTVVFCLSPNSVSSKVCGWEVEEAARLGKRILPVVAKRVADADVPPALAKLNFIFMDGKAKAQGLVALKDAIESDLPWLREHTRLGDLAQQWNARPGNAGVLRGPALEEAERWIASQPLNAALTTDLHRNFIAASRKAATTRQRYWFGGAAAIVTLSLGLAGWSEINRREAERQTAIAEEQRTEAQTQRNSAEQRRKEAEKERQRSEDLLASSLKQIRLIVDEINAEAEKKKGFPVGLRERILDGLDGFQDQEFKGRQGVPIIDKHLLFEATQQIWSQLSEGNVNLDSTWADKVLAAYGFDVESGHADPEVDRLLVNFHLAAGEAYSQSGKSKEALRQFGLALPFFANHGFEQSGSVQMALESIKLAVRIGNAYRDAGELTQAEKQYASGGAELRKMLASEDASYFHAELRRGLARLLLEKAEVFRLQRRLAEAQSALVESGDLLEQVASGKTGDKSVDYDIAVQRFRLAQLLEERMQRASGISHLEQCKALLEKMVVSGTVERDWLLLLAEVYGALERQGVERRENLRRNISLHERMVSDGTNTNALELELERLKKRIAVLDP